LGSAAFHLTAALFEISNNGLFPSMQYLIKLKYNEKVQNCQEKSILRQEKQKSANILI